MPPMEHEHEMRDWDGTDPVAFNDMKTVAHVTERPLMRVLPVGLMQN